MDAAAGAFGGLIPKLWLLLKEEYNLQKGVRRRVNFLARELESIYAAVREVSDVPPDMLDEQVRDWARKAREAAYNMEDRLDTFLVSVIGCSEPIEDMGCWWLKRAKTKMDHLTSKDRARVYIAAAIEEMIKQVQELDERRERYKINDQIELRTVTSTSSVVDPRLPALYRNERELVGIEEAREELDRLLTQEDDKKQKVKVVSIVGLPGVGKTTLAKAVYNRLHQKQFDCSAFVSVSRHPDLKEVFRDILLELDEAKYRTGMDTYGMYERQLIYEILRFLENKRYLIVIDDVWSVRDWEQIFYALCHGGNGSRIINTTRNYAVAERFGSAIYRLKPLSHVNSEKLFYKRMFGDRGNCREIMAEVSDKILKKCSGIPLAIIAVASVLASRPWKEWSEVYNSIALRHESNRYVDNMRRVLSFSFYDLNPILRTCLFYLSIFPENCFIEKDFLIWKWIAEGFLHDREERHTSLFQIGESYFFELGNTSMIQISEEYLNKGRVYGCRAHPVLLSQIRAISSEENLCTVLEDEKHKSPGNNNYSRIIAMHSIRNVEHNIVPGANMDMEKVRSFNASLCFVEGMPRLSSFQVLRVLALEYCPGMNSQHHLAEIGNLLHLRYLGLIGAGVLELPEQALGRLRFLQTLDLRETGIEQWPRTISKLQQLLCLCVGQTRILPEGIGRLSSLEDLRLHHVTGDSVNLATELIRMQSLRVLVLGFEKMDVELEKAMLESLGNLYKIERLEIYWKLSTRAVTWDQTNWMPPPHIRQLVIGGHLFSRLPSWINRLSLPRLSHLQLGVEVMEDQHLKVLAQFPNLCSLMMMATTGNEQEHSITIAVGSSDHAFKRLNFFSTNMAVRFERGLQGPPMPNLEHVELRVRVAHIADSGWLSSLANLPSLEKLTVVLDCRGVSPAETEEAEKTLRYATGVHLNGRLKLEVTKENGNDEVPLVEQFRFKNPRFEILRSEMEKMQANRQVQVQHDNGSDEEITPAKVASE